MPEVVGPQTEAFGLVKKAVESAQELGALQASALWALFCLVLLAYIAYKLKQERSDRDTWFTIRLEDAKSDFALAQAVQKLVDKLVEDVQHIKTIIEDRRGRR
jgi:hypothetical protein